jgi:hypothetical protein
MPRWRSREVPASPQESIRTGAGGCFVKQNTTLTEMAEPVELGT